MRYCAICGCRCGDGYPDYTGTLDHERVHGHSFSGLPMSGETAWTRLNADERNRDKLDYETLKRANEILREENKLYISMLLKGESRKP